MSKQNPKKPASIPEESLGYCGKTDAEGCAEFVTARGSALTGLSWDEYYKQAYGGPSDQNNAWQRKHNSLKAGGQEVKDPMQAEIGDHVSIFYPGSFYTSEAENAPNSEKNTHIGIVIGRSASP